jgi:GNAT superfamily N-acetyltransferase
MTTTEVRELTDEEGWLTAFPVLRELRDHLTEARYLEYLRAMREEGYRLFALVESEDGSESEAIVAVAGAGIRTNFYNGRHLFVYDLVTRPDRRSEGFGGTLMGRLERWARERGCESITLESGLWREDAHRFYEDHLGMDRYCYTFKRTFEVD